MFKLYDCGDKEFFDVEVPFEAIDYKFDKGCAYTPPSEDISFDEAIITEYLEDGSTTEQTISYEELTELITEEEMSDLIGLIGSEYMSVYMDRRADHEFEGGF